MNELLQTGVELMLIGMGIVFTFLILLVGIVTVMANVFQRFAPSPETSSATGKPSQEVAAAITAAIHRHRASR